MSISQLLKSNRLPRRQKGQRIETKSAWCLRYYVDGVQKFITLADKSDLYRSWADVEPLIARVLDGVNTRQEVITGQASLADFIEAEYLPWCRENKAAPTSHAYEKIWACYWKPHIGTITLTNLQTAQVTTVLTHHAKAGLSRRTLSHVKWMLSGVYVYAISIGLLPKNPVPDAKWLVKVARPVRQKEYSLADVLAMLAILEPLDLRAAVAVALTYFAALRPAEARGLRWEDWTGAELQVRRTVWRDQVGETKTEESAASVTVIEPLRSLLEKLQAQSTSGHILQSDKGKPLNLDTLSVYTIAPALKKAGIAWRGYFPGRRGMSSKLTDRSKNIQNAQGHLRHASSATTAGFYTQPQKDSVNAALKGIEEEAKAMMAAEPETIQ